MSGACIGTCWGRGCFWGYAFEGPSNGSSVLEGPAHTFLAAPSPLSRLLFRFVVVSILSWSSLFFFFFFAMWVILVLMMLSLVLGSVALSSLLLLFLVLLLLLVFPGFWFGFEVGIPLDFFLLVWGNPSSSVSPRTSPLCHLFWAGPDSGPEPRLSYCCWWWWWLLKLLLWLLSLLLQHSQVSRGRTSRCGQFVCMTNTSVSAPPPSLSSVCPR